MSQQQQQQPSMVPESPGTAVPGNAAPADAPAPALVPAPAPAPSDVSRQIAQLTDAVNRLVQAQQAPRSHQEQPPSSAPTEIGGDLPGGGPLLPAVDVARLSPVQQIALGLRDAKPVGPAHPKVLQATARPSRGATPDLPPSGAD